jgi:hypothetical protein
MEVKSPYPFAEKPELLLEMFWKPPEVEKLAIRYALFDPVAWQYPVKKVF